MRTLPQQPAPNPDIQLPTGADSANSDEWQPAQDGHRSYRLVWSAPFETSLDIRVVVVQYTDGTIAAVAGDAPLVYIASDDYSPDAARVLAGAIVKAADLADKWATR